MSVVLDRPYEFVPPHRGNLWPTCIQKLRIVDRYLRRKEGVVSYECRNIEHFKRPLENGDGILLAPNHCRYADPLVLGWPAREVQSHVYAMASWHLFNKGSFDSFAIQKMGGFSINREGTDRQSLETAINALATADRPLILFPEGTTNRTNDVLKPLLDGVSFIARSAARRRAKGDGGNVVMVPIALKYLCKGDFREWADEQITEMERRLGWGKKDDLSIRHRTVRLAEGFLTLKEIEYLGTAQSGDLPSRRDSLIEQVLRQAESRLGIEPSSQEDVRDRVRVIRSDVVSKYFSLPEGSEDEQKQLKQDVEAAELAQELFSYPNSYLLANQATDTRIVETIQRMQEFHYGESNNSIPLHVVIEFDEAIEVPPSKAPRGEEDPIMTKLRESLSGMINKLSKEARPLVSS